MPIPPKKESKTPEHWYEMKANDQKEGELFIYDQIGKDYWGDDSAVEAKKFINDLKTLGDLDVLNIRINSPGGNMAEGNAIYNALKANKAQKIVTIDALAASMASVIAMVGDTIRMPKNAMMMIHNPLNAVYGEAKDMRKMADTLDKFKIGAVAAYAAKTGKPDAEISDLMDETTWMTADEALAMGFCDEVIDPVDIAANFDLSKFKNVPQSFLEQIPNTEKPEPPKNQVIEERGEPDMPITMEQLQKEAPELVASIQAQAKKEAEAAQAVTVENAKKEAAKEAAAAELKRIQEVEAQQVPGCEDLINQLKNDGKTTGAEAAVAVVNFIRKQGADFTNLLREEAVKPVNGDVSNHEDTEDPMKATTPLTMEEATQIYNSDERVKKHFSSAKNFFHFRKNANK